MLDPVMVNAESMMMAFTTREKFRNDKELTIPLSEVPLLTLGACIKDDQGPAPKERSMKEMAGFTARFESPIEPPELAILIGQTNDAIWGYLDRQDRLKEKARKQKKNGLPETEPETPETPEEELAREKALEKALDILKNGSPLESLREGFLLNHVGHEEIFRVLIYAFCAQSSMTSKGIQPETTGAKGSGKTHANNSTLHELPQEYVYKKSMSPKALYHIPPKQGSVIYIDEKLKPDLVDLVKRVMSNFQEDTEYSTMDGTEWVTLKIPKRQVILGSTVHGVGDDQFNDRTVQVGIINAKKDDEEYAKFEATRRQEGRPEYQITEHIEVCRCMLRIIREHEFRVKMPDITFAYVSDRRLINIFYDLCEASAILHYMQRVYTAEPDGGIISVVPNKNDVAAALDFEMFRMARPDTDGRLSKQQVALHNVIQENISKNSCDRIEVEELSITDWYGKSQQAVRKLLYGSDGSSQHITGGLVEKTTWYKIGNGRERNTIFCNKVGSITRKNDDDTWYTTFATIKNP